MGQARVAAQPMLPLRLFGVRGVVVGNVMLLLFGAIAIAMWYFTSLFLQKFTPAAVLFMVVARWAPPCCREWGAPLVLAGAAFFLAGFGWLSQADAGSDYVTGLAPRC